LNTWFKNLAENEMPENLLLYGAYGYTGSLIARAAAKRGVPIVLAGRNPHKLAAQAVELGMEHLTFDLEDRPALERALSDVGAVLHCAGPFSHTTKPMVQACLRTGTHYLDITGEVAIFEALAARDGEAQAAGITLLPGAGFDVVPSDCLAAYLKEQLPSATQLVLAIQALSQPSRGTAKTAIEQINQAGLVRQNGKLMPVPAGSLTRQVDFGRGPKNCVCVPWGDLSTAYVSTGIPNIEVYFPISPSLRYLFAATRYVGWILASRPSQQLLKATVQRMPSGPTAEQRTRVRSILWGEVVDPTGQRRSARLVTPEAYALTAQTALAAAERVLAGHTRPGFLTPSLAFGADFILAFDGVTRE
jgi:short subunit dehydrogenase-like uncharacterized protein